MTDLEITKLCAEAMKVKFSVGWFVTDKTGKETGSVCYSENIYGIGLSDENIAAHLEHGTKYRPLESDPFGDAQAMALVKKFDLQLITKMQEGERLVYPAHDANVQARNSDMNRAICECVAKMQGGKR